MTDTTNRCEAAVFVRDTYRRCGGKQQFRMHYTKKRCKRAAVSDGLCAQHMKRIAVLRVPGWP